MLKKTYDTWMETNAYPSEPIFVPRPNSQVYILNFVLTVFMNISDQHMAYLLFAERG